MFGASMICNHTQKLHLFKAGPRSYDPCPLKKISYIFISFILLSVTAGNAYAAWYDNNWTYRKKITVQSSLVASDQVSFPVLINTTDTDWKDILNSGKVGKSNGGDILFTSSNGTSKLSHEMEIYNPSTGQVVAWVNVPSVSSSVDTEIYIYYGNAGAPDQWETDGSTWNSSYGMVYHMDTAGMDSTFNNRNRTADVGSPSEDNTYLGKGLSFDGTNGWDQTDLVYWEEEWYVRSHEIVFKTGGDINARQTLFAEGGGANGVMLYILNGDLYARWWSESQGWNGDYISSAISLNTTYHVIISYEYPGGSYEMFVDGFSIGSGATSVFMNSHGGDGGIAYTGPSEKDYHDESTTGNYFIGSIYEFRIRDNATDSSYAATTFNNQSSPSTFYSITGEELAPVRYWTGGDGNWSDTGHWSATSGGVTGAAKPGSGDLVYFDSNSGTGTCTFDADVSLIDISMQAGNSITVDTANYTINISGNFKIAAGIFNAYSSTINVGGNWDSSGGAWNRMTSTVNLTGTGTLAQYTASSPWNWGFNNLSIAASGQTTTLTSSSLWINKLTVGSGTITDGANSYSIYLQGSGDVFVDGGASITIQNLYYRIGNSTQNVAGRDYTGISLLGFFGVGGSSGSNTYNVQGDIIADNIQVAPNNNSGNVRTSILNTNNYDITCTNLYIGRSGDTNDYAALNAGSSNITISGNVDIYSSDASGSNEIDTDTSNWNVSGNWTNNDIFTADSSTIIFTGISDQTITSTGSAFYNLTLNNTGTSGNDDIIINGNLDVDGTLTITDGNLDLATYNPNVNTAGNITIGTNGSVTKGTGIWSFNGTTIYTDNSISGIQNLGTVVVE